MGGYILEEIGTVFVSGPTQLEQMSLSEVRKDGAPFRASDSCGDFSEEFIADVLEAKMEAQLGPGMRFACVDDLVADLLED